ncbi:hypothetical protein BS47DRAFT_1297838, partial [Hydnum rufescens UP504]
WMRVWSTDPLQCSQSNVKIVNQIPPSLSATKRLQELSRMTFSRVLQCHTGHAHLGSYYTTFVPEEDPRCPCGESTQTREHILTECPLFEDHRHLLGDGEDCQMRHLLGTAKGIGHLAQFIEALAVFTKLSTT